MSSIGCPASSSRLMALNRYVLTATVTVPAGTASAVAQPGDTVSYSSPAELFPQTFIKGTAIVLDPAGPLFAAIGAGNLRAYVQGQDDTGHAALAN